MEFQGDFDILLHPLVEGDNESDGFIVWIRIDVGYILRLNLHDIEAGVRLNCEGFSVVRGVDEYLSLLIFLHIFCFKLYQFFFFIGRRAGGIGGGII